MNSKLFGTDGIRGIVCENLTPTLCYNLGKALAIMAREENAKNFVIGGDTRLSTDMLKFSFIVGATSHGMNVTDIGIVPTPAISHITNQMYDFGVMITASHNPPQYNGIKIFEKDGNKLTECKIKQLEYILVNINDYGLQKYDKIGKYEVIDLSENYCQAIINDIKINLTGLKVALDCSFGACYKCADTIYNALNANYEIFNDKFNGLNINKDCGALNVEFIQKTVTMNDFDIGFAFDGDGDRVICVTKSGKVLDGDSIMYVLAKYLKLLNLLYGDVVVATILSNCGFEQSLARHGIKLLRTNVGDKNVSVELQKNKYALGGEKAGHIIYNDFGKTGDGIYISLLLLKLQKISGIKIEEMLNDLVIYPYIECDIEVPANKKYKVIKTKTVINALDECLMLLADKGRIVLRPSGTENKVRILVEGEDNQLNQKIANILTRKIQSSIKYL